jgi:Icc-related predicted phosphoesterase
LDVVEGHPERHCGSFALRDAILEKSPKYCFCGHIHTGDHNENLLGKTICQNVSLLDEEYKVRYPVRVLEI